MLAFGHFRSETLLCETSWLTKCFAQTVFCRKLENTLIVGEVKLSCWVLFEHCYLILDVGLLGVALCNHVLEQLVDFRHLTAVPSNFIFRVISSIFKKTAGFQHVCVLLDVESRLSFTKVLHLVFKISTLVRKNLICIFFSAGAALKFGQISAFRQAGLYLGMFILEKLKFSSHCLKKQRPRLVKQLVFFKLSPHVAFVLFVMSCDLRFPLLENFNFKTSFSRPLLA